MHAEPACSSVDRGHSRGDDSADLAGWWGVVEVPAFGGWLVVDEQQRHRQFRRGTCIRQLNFDEVLTTGTPDGQVTVIVNSALCALKFTAA